MPDYRIYPLDANGHRQAARDFIFPDDLTAIAVTRRMVIGAARAEIWANKRLVGTVAALDVPVPET